ARAAAEHLLPQDARLDRAQKHDEFQRRDVHAGREHVHGDDDLGIRAIAELADALERPVYVRVAVIFCTKASPCLKRSRQMRTSWSACDVCGMSLTAKMRIFGKRPVAASCS